jgi:thiamine-phosphate pyrophosphorylase
MHAPAQTQSQRILYRILDANLDRAREGLRILEEWCRFGLQDAGLTEQFKQLRQQLAQYHGDELRWARNTPDDPGTGLTHPQETYRDSLQSVLQANFCRVQEALRTLEEYGKLSLPALAVASKQMRYEVYRLEGELLGYARRQQLLRSQTYLVTSPVENLLSVVEAALQGGIDIVQYREKSADDCDRLPLAQKIRDLCYHHQALFIVNDRIDLALAVDADGVHLGQRDLPMPVARDLLGPHRIVGRSTTNPEELARAIAEGADYIGVGPVHATPTKPGKAAAGYDYVRYAVTQAPMPWFAIGGIDTDNLQAVTDAGATRIAVVRAIMEAPQPLTATQQFVNHMRTVS